MKPIENVAIIYAAIFLTQIIRFAIGTLRTVLITKGEKIVNICLNFIESLMSILLAAQILTNIQNDPMQALMYILGATVGSYIGMVLENKLALGENVITIVVDVEQGEKIVKHVRSKGYGATVIDGKGIKDKKYVILIAINRRKEKKLIDSILSDDNSAVIIKEDTSIKGGYY